MTPTSRSSAYGERLGSGGGDSPGTEQLKEHAAEAARLGGEDAHRVRLVNAELGVVQTEADVVAYRQVRLDQRPLLIGELPARHNRLPAGSTRRADPGRRV
ncbi:DUF6245 family protein [Streptomyces sp. NPDC005181]|uniref:DUF6245 family protein n=1 Tax=Streptomyces sp. NPDC005181 TaxID=3156869 RepID=UPI0033A7240E